MAISFVGAATGTTSATLPSFNSGDCAVVFAFRDGSTTNPSVPAGWTNLTNTLDGSTCSVSIGWRRLLVGDTTTGTWTNASIIAVQVYRGCEPFIAPFLLGGTAQGTVNTSVAMQTFTLNRTDATSWVAGFVGHRSVDTDLNTAWTGMTSRQNPVNATAEMASQDTNGAVSSWSTQTRSIGGTASGWISYTIEVRALQAQTPGELILPPFAPMKHNRDHRS